MKTEQFCDHAKERREQAEKTVSPLHKEHWLKLAADWERMAIEADRNSGAF